MYGRISLPQPKVCMGVHSCQYPPLILYSVVAIYKINQVVHIPFGKLSAGSGNHSGAHTNVRRGPFLISVARIFSGGALFPPKS